MPWFRHKAYLKKGSEFSESSVYLGNKVQDVYVKLEESPIYGRIVGNTLELDGNRREPDYQPVTNTDYSWPWLPSWQKLEKVSVCGYPDSSSRLYLPEDCSSFMYGLSNIEEIDGSEKFYGGHVISIHSFFQETEKLRGNITIDAPNLSIAWQAFSGSGLDNVTINVDPGFQQTINGTMAFYNMNNVDTITITSGENHCFVNLNSAFANSSVRVIDMSNTNFLLHTGKVGQQISDGAHIFDNCSNLEHIYINSLTLAEDIRIGQDTVEGDYTVFLSCFNLHNYNMADERASKRDYAMIDDGYNKGYFEEKHDEMG